MDAQVFKYQNHVERNWSKCVCPMEAYFSGRCIVGHHFRLALGKLQMMTGEEVSRYAHELIKTIRIPSKEDKVISEEDSGDVHISQFATMTS